MRALRHVVVLLLLTAAASFPLAAQEKAYPRYEVHGRLQPQFYAFDDANVPPGSGGDLGPSSNFVMRRARIEARFDLTERLFFVVQPSFENPRNRVRLRDAYVAYRLSPTGDATQFQLRFGQEKRPFGAYENFSSNNLPSIERGAGPGLRLASSTHNLFEANGFLSHDVGAWVHMETPLAGRELTLHVGVFNGEGESISDVNSAKSWGARATFALTEKLRLGASYADHETATPNDTLLTGVGPTRHNQAFGLEATYGVPGARGLFVVADYMDGEDRSDARRPIRGFNVVAAWHARVGDGEGAIWAVEPVVRFDQATADVDDDDLGTSLWGAGVGLYFTARAHLRVMAEFQDSDDPARESVTGVRSQFSVSF